MSASSRQPRLHAHAVCICLGACGLSPAASADDRSVAPAGNPATALELPQVTVIANAPLAGLGLPPEQIPANVQTGDRREMERQQVLGLAEYLNGNFSGVADFVSQDFMVTESMGPIYDRSQEQLGSTDRAITRMRHILLSAAKGLAEGKEPPALAGDFRSIRGAEKILEPDEDWRLLGTDADPVVREAFDLDEA